MYENIIIENNKMKWNILTEIQVFVYPVQVVCNFIYYI